MEQLRCVIERVTYRNENNGFSVIKGRAKGFKELITLTGIMAAVNVGSILIAKGNWKIDPKYGKQFVIEAYEETLPATVYGIEKYLGSGLIKGVGSKYAKKIVQHFGKDTIEIIENEPDRLLEIEGIGKLRVERIKQGWEEQKEVKNIMLFLSNHNVSTAHATKIYKEYGNDSIDIIRENPYKLADDIRGIGFITADEIAKKLGYGQERFMRLRSGIFYSLNKLAEEGHCYAKRDELIKKSVELLGVEDNLISMTLDNLIHEGDLITQNIPHVKNNSKKEEYNKAIYLPPFYWSEIGVARRLFSISNTPSDLKVNTNNILENLQKKTRIQYDETQLQAIIDVLNNKVTVLTGGPGTGKTTTTLGIITVFKELGANILLAAPTGRAAKRLSEATGLEAKTIHRLLEAQPTDGYKRNEDNPLGGDVLIVDECSMIDIILAYNLLKAIPDTMKLVLVGDTDQLPSIGAGNFLKDIIDSERFKTIRLNKIFRQAQQSRIIMNAHNINQGKMPDLSNGRYSDFFFIDLEKEASNKNLTINPSTIGNEAVDQIVNLVKSRLPKKYGVRPQDIQVLTPMQRGLTGAIRLNTALQQALNPNSLSLKRSGYSFKVGDKVMQIKNNYDKDVYNGDIGYIISIDLENQTLTVDFDGKKIQYENSETDELMLAYATTIHKAQGSEYSIVIMPILPEHHVMLQRNLIYTGITRSKILHIIIGLKTSLKYAINNETVAVRNTLLKERFKSQL